MKLKNLIKEYEYTKGAVAKHIANEFRYELKNVQNEFESKNNIMFYNTNWKTLGASTGQGIEPEKKGLIPDFFYYLDKHYKNDRQQYDAIINSMKHEGVIISPSKTLGYWEIKL